MADQFSGLDTRANRTRKIVHTCDLQHACRFAHEKDWCNCMNYSICMCSDLFDIEYVVHAIPCLRDDLLHVYINYKNMYVQQLV